ncbi:glutathione transferase GstA [Shewanella cyperi]|uniref:glutathione transferase GstA n=1 Tax=Shewanella cyperi TaxID=2814292 RepID=UPI001A93BBCB|nr:glutathione transferase GstA [Shewanella cyperi]QSX40012.1 glutathione transferase GstA [Shewanella cyperi]
MKLYFSPGTCSLAPHIVMREAGLAFDLEQVDLNTRMTAGGEDYLQIHGRGQVPLLQLDNGEHLSEGPVIARFIAELAKAHALVPPAGSPRRYRVDEWQNFIGTELHKGYSPLFNGDLDTNAKSVLRGVLRKKYEWLNRQLAKGQYLTGDDFSAADAYLFVVTRWSQYVDLDLSDLGELQAFMARVAQRPAVQAALSAEGLA